MNKRKAFTLIELLVVIAIIALLMAILMPALNRAKKQAKSAACQVNLHQWGTIWSMYCDDNDGYFCGTAMDAWGRGQWVIALRPYYDTKGGILECPMATKRPPRAGESGWWWGGPFNTYRMGAGGIGDRQEEASYGLNLWVYDPKPGQTKIGGHPTKYNWKTHNVKGGNKIPVFVDSMWRGGSPTEMGVDGDPPEFAGQWLGSGRGGAKHFCINRHNGSENYLFMDWSIRKVGLKELWKLKWHREFDTAGPWTQAGGVQPTEWPQWMRKFKDY